METVLDYNITPQEWEKVIGVRRKTFDKVLSSERGETQSNLWLALLFWERGKKLAAKVYADKLPDTLRQEFWQTVTHP